MLLFFSSLFLLFPLFSLHRGRKKEKEEREKEERKDFSSLMMLIQQLLPSSLLSSFAPWISFLSFFSPSLSLSLYFFLILLSFPPVIFLLCSHTVSNDQGKGGRNLGCYLSAIPESEKKRNSFGKREREGTSITSSSFPDCLSLPDFFFSFFFRFLFIQFSFLDSKEARLLKRRKTFGGRNFLHLFCSSFDHLGLEFVVQFCLRKKKNEL